jgi:porphobilinogen synthase
MAPAGLRRAHISAEDLIMPYFVIDGKNKKEAIASMPGIRRLSVDNLIKDIKEAKGVGIKAVLLFGICNKKDDAGSAAYSRTGVIQKAVTAIKSGIKDITVMTDVCLCGYTSHGHCGILKAGKKIARDGVTPLIDHGKTLKALAKIALSHARAGADFVAPSAMRDNQVGTIRKMLDSNGFGKTKIMAYSAKYASSFYGPFRDALHSAPKFGDRKSYQMDYGSSDRALEEIRQDIDEGADIVMVKPALAYLDIIYRAKEKFNLPIAAYNVSGEYSLLKVGAKNGIVNEKDASREVLTSIKRAGADLIITYHAKEVAECLAH